MDGVNESRNGERARWRTEQDRGGEEMTRERVLGVVLHTGVQTFNLMIY